jgi:hypothetical protein
MTIEECKENIGRRVMYLGYPSPELGVLIGVDGKFAAVRFQTSRVATRCISDPLIILIEDDHS